VLNATYEGVQAFATGDLVREHPTEKGLFQIFGRADEQIMLSTGEKTNPVPLGA
jgi:long-subunit acyl-CoA synthetase (AMP-forming)